MEGADVPRVSFGVAAESSPRGLRVTAGSLTWVGVLGAHTRGERVELRVEQRVREGTSAFDWIVDVASALPLPGAAWLELAAHLWAVDEDGCVELVDGRRPTDECLRLALEERATKTAKRTARVLSTETLHQFDDAMRFADVRVGRGDEAFFVGIGPKSAWKLGAGRGPASHVSDVSELGGRPYLLDTLEATDGEVLAAVYDAESHRCRLLPHATDGDFDTALELTLSVAPVAFFRAEGLLAIVGGGEFVAIPADPPGGPGASLPLPKLGAYAPARPHRIGRFVTSGTTERRVNVGWSLHDFGWIDLRGEFPKVPIETHGMPTFMRVVGESLYFVDEKGLSAARGGEPARVIAGGTFHGAFIEADSAWLGDQRGRPAIIRVHLEDGSVLQRIELTVFPATIARVGRSLVVHSTSAFAIVDEAGGILAQSDQRREGRSVALADGTTFVNAGEELAVLAPDGSMRRRRTMPYDGCLEGASREHALFGSASTGWERVAPDVLHVLDANGSTVATTSIRREDGVHIPHYVAEAGLVRRSAITGGDHFLLVTEGGRALVRHRIASHDSPAREAQRTSWISPARHDETQRRGVTYSPRDDWPEAGLTVRASALLATSSTYGGTTGVSQGPAIEAHDGAVVVLVDCELCEGGLELTGPSVVVLFRCRFGNKPWSLGRAGRVLVSECAWSGRIPVSGGEGCAIHHDGHAHFTRFTSGGGTLERLA